ncbi:thiolase family protein [Actinokineospora sp. 24-640]
MRDAVVVGAVRTAVGRRRGGLSRVHPVDLSGAVLVALAERVGFDPGRVDDVVWGCVGQVGEQSLNVGRNAVLAAGWPVSVPGTTVDRQCGSGQQAVAFAAATVVSGQADFVVAGGVEVMSRVPMGASATGGSGRASETGGTGGAKGLGGTAGAGEGKVGEQFAGMPYGPMVRERFGGLAGFDAEEAVAFDLGVAAELIAAKWGLSRARLDEYALGSHAKAATATDSGWFAGEITPVAGLTVDECIRRDTSPAKMASLSTPFREDGVVTAGTASQNSDGAAALAITTSEWARAHGLTPLARVHTCVVAGDDPVIGLTAPIPATAKALRRAGLGIGDIGAFEVNEAFAPVVLAWLAETGADPGRVNARGGAIALGHPLGASGVRVATTLVHHMRDAGVRFGLQTMCQAGGLANATVYELL